MEKIKAKLYELQAQALQVFGVKVDFTVRMNGRLTSTAGRATYVTGLLEFSTSLYAENEEYFINNTVPHEFCHLLAYRIYGEAGYGHGVEWKHCMHTLGYSADRLHSLETQKRGNYTTMRCGCQEHQFSPQRMAWVRKGKVYRCTACKEIIK